MDYNLLEFFQFQKTLAEIDQMDIGRLTRAVEAGRLQRVWSKKRDELSKEDWAFKQGRIYWYKNEGRYL